MQGRICKRYCGWSLIVVVIFLLTIFSADAVRFSAQPIQLTSSAAKMERVHQNRSPFLASVLKNAQVLVRGSKGLLTEIRKTIELKRLQKKNGIHSISFTDFKFLEQARNDLSKCVRLMVTIPLSPEYFFYSNLVFPLFSSHNPWVWKALPSTFDDPHDAEIRERALVKRRMQTAVLSLHTLQGETLDDLGAPNVRQNKIAIMERLERALKQKSFDKALEELEPWLISPNEKKAKRLSVSSLPGIVVKQCLRSFGADGVPNIPIIRRLNVGELNSRIKKVGESDSFLATKGVASLSPQELKAACFERCISTLHKGEAVLRGELVQWLDLVNRPMPGTRAPTITATRFPTRSAARASVVSPKVAASKGSGSVKSSAVGSAALDSKGSTGKLAENVATKVGVKVEAGAPGVLNKRGGVREPVLPVTNFQNKRLALMALHAAKDLKTSDFGSLYRAALSSDSA